MSKPTARQITIRNHILSSNSGLKRFIGDYYAPELQPREVSVIEAVTTLVVKQMLSMKAADTILERLDTRRKQRGLDYIAELDKQDLREQGLSERKAKTIGLFYEQCRQNEGYRHWRDLDTEALYREVNSYWGLSDWTASMLAIFYFAHEDVYPRKDASIRNVVQHLEGKGVLIRPEETSPYRSYLSLYLYWILDNRL